MPELHEKIRNLINVDPSKLPEIPQYISDNLKYEFFDWQKGDFDVKFIVSTNISYDAIDNSDKLDLVIKFLDNFFAELKSTIVPKIGGEFIAGDFKQFFDEPKRKIINPANEDSSVTNNTWYVLDGFVGTSEEKKLIGFIKNTIINLEQRYEKVYLLRNEEVYKIYDFEQGRGFQPDFILFLKNPDFYYQIFIEPKGKQFIGSDSIFRTGKEGWKEKFLEDITKKYGFDNVIKAENSNYKLIGLPFFNNGHNTEFIGKFNQILYCNLKGEY